MTQRKPIIPETREALQQAIDNIRRSPHKKNVADEDIAAALGIPVTSLHAFLEGKEKTPAYLPSQLMAAYGIVTEIISITETEEIDDPDDNTQSPEELWQTLQHLVTAMQKTGKAHDKIITLEDMAKAAGLTAQQLQNCLDGKDPVPPDLSAKLLEFYASLLNSNIEDDRRAALAQTLVLIRNAGLDKGMDITLKEMSEKLGLTAERVRAYLYGQWDAGKDLSSLLQNAYGNILGKKNTVTVREDIHMILSE
ncbi:MAG: hypothetical protein JST39_25230 [Bacteroidetes bacterium]|nr:hypothetical protein [Bacteroidota bacterium]